MSVELELLRELAGEWEPPAEVAAAARARLRAAIAEEVSLPAERRWRLRLPRLPFDLRLRPAARLGFAILVLVVGMIAVAGLLAPPAAVARLSQLATAAERVPVEALAEGEFAYTRSIGESLNEIPDPRADGSFIRFRLRTTREEWRGADGSGLVRITSGELEFLNPEDAEFVTPAAAEALGAGTTVEVPFGPGTSGGVRTDLPTEVSALETFLYREVEKGPRIRPTAVGVFDQAADLLRARDASPELRAAVFRVLARLDGVSLLPAEAGQTTLAIDFDVPGGQEVLTMTFEEEDTSLVAESTTRIVDFPAPGEGRRQVLARVEYSPVEIVDRAG